MTQEELNKKFKALLETFDPPLKNAVISSIQDIRTSNDNEIAADAFRILLCAQRYKRHYDSASWNDIKPQIGELLDMMDKEVEDIKSPTHRHISEYKKDLGIAK